ncbi:hypothetical protein NGRA_1264 [Nosema granulosis]|uniref:Uncharacterized protein n=1 Tax=Nosema granulosis TaxID=83296 RepID=A0A9P6GZC8_9MICR|nr:hypothetical protein NGRA_1264 [Nosema granulosis]
MISKETRFVDLPQEIKQKLINIHKISQQKYIRTDPLKIVNFNYLYSQAVDIQSNDLSKNLDTLEKSYATLEKVFNNVKRCIDFRYVEAELSSNIKSLKEDIETFNTVGENLDFCGELQTTYKTLDRRFEELSHRVNK